MTDQTPNAGSKRDRELREWTAIGVGLTGLLSILAVIVSLVALSSPTTNTTTVEQVSSPRVAASVPAPLAMKMTVKSDDQHGRRGPDGKWHDAFSHADFSVKAGQTVTITVANYDDAAHSFNSPALGVNEVIPGGSDKGPHTVTFTFKAPSKPGSYEWFCAMPCDPWAMAHDGYMRGHVTVVA